jgi:hypothetical protein
MLLDHLPCACAPINTPLSGSVASQEGLLPMERSLILGREIVVAFGASIDVQECRVWLGFDEEPLMYIFNPYANTIDIVAIKNIENYSLDATLIELTINMTDGRKYMLRESTQQNINDLCSSLSLKIVSPRASRKSLKSIFGVVEDSVFDAP